MNLPYHLARVEGKIARSFYRSALAGIGKRRIQVAREFPFEVFSYSGQITLPEQAASIQSFLRYAGRPKQFTVLSDGSYTRSSVELLCKIDNCVRVQTTLPALPPGLPDKVKSYLSNHPTGKQLALLMSLPANGPALYTDSDVLFFPGSDQLIDLGEANSTPAFYLADYQFSGDERLLLGENEKQNPVNTGFILLFQKIDWSLGLDRLAKLNGEPTFFTNQTVTHLCLHANGARAFDPTKFILQEDDQFLYSDRYAGESIAIRHYVNPVRHKFWTAVARQAFR